MYTQAVPCASKYTYITQNGRLEQNNNLKISRSNRSQNKKTPGLIVCRVNPGPGVVSLGFRKAWLQKCDKTSSAGTSGEKKGYTTSYSCRYMYLSLTLVVDLCFESVVRRAAR